MFSETVIRFNHLFFSFRIKKFLISINNPNEFRDYFFFFRREKMCLICIYVDKIIDLDLDLLISQGLIKRDRFAICLAVNSYLSTKDFLNRNRQLLEDCADHIRSMVKEDFESLPGLLD